MKNALHQLWLSEAALVSRGFDRIIVLTIALIMFCAWSPVALSETTQDIMTTVSGNFQIISAAEPQSGYLGRTGEGKRWRDRRVRLFKQPEEDVLPTTLSWAIEPAANGQYRIRSLSGDSDLYLTWFVKKYRSGSHTWGLVYLTKNRESSTRQLWDLKALDNGQYLIGTSRGSFYLTRLPRWFKRGDRSFSDRVILRNASKYKAQRWKLDTIDKPDDNCVVGDACPPQRLVSYQGMCLITGAFGDVGDSFFVSGGCDRRPEAFNVPTRQVRFLDSGQISLNGFCFEVVAGVSGPRLAVCADNPMQQWTVTDDGRIIAADGRCMATTDDPNLPAVELFDCATHPQPIWGFIPIDRNRPHTVQAVYIVADDSAQRGREDVLQRALDFVQADWADFGVTWTLADAPIVLSDFGKTCSDIQTLGDVRSIATRELSVLKKFDYNTKYNVVAECPTTGAANASNGIAVYNAAIFDLTEAQLRDVDPDNAADGEMSEVGVYGHELGHTFGLPHENCAVGGFQGGQSERGAYSVLGLPLTPTKGPMCNGAYYPNNDDIADFQRELIYENSCDWIAECDSDLDFAENGRPYGCGLTGAPVPTLLWDVNEIGRASEFTFYRYTFEEDAVVITTGVPYSASGYTDPSYLPNADNYYAISLIGAVPAERQFCGSIIRP